MLVLSLLFNDLMVLALFFFFQAEDGIRDGRVTGVQTCALPISVAGALADDQRWVGRRDSHAGDAGLEARGHAERSEERRVGKECRARGTADHYKEKGDEGIDSANQDCSGTEHDGAVTRAVGAAR